jgi:putative peptidoglycan lipid II flippase
MKTKIVNNLISFSSLTIISRILGFVRDMIIARAFGVSIATDAFFVAFKLPNMLRRITAEGAFTQAFIPTLSDYKNKSKKEFNAFLNKVVTLLSVILLLITLIGVFASPWLIYISAPGFEYGSYQFNLASDLLKITFPYIFLISVVAMFGGVLNTFGKFAAPAFSPVFLNLSFILAALFFYDYFDEPVTVLAWAVFFGGVVQLLFQYPFILKIGWSPKLDFDLSDDGVWKVLKLMGPAIIGVSITQISLLINTIFASFLQQGSVSWLYFADRLMEFPAGVLGVALSTVFLPALSSSFSNKKYEEFNKLMNWSIRIGLLVSIPSAIGIAVLSIPLITTLFYYGKFSELDLVMTHKALFAYSFGLIGLIMIKVFAPVFYSQKNIKTPVSIAVITLFVTQAMNLILIPYFQHVGLALAISVGATFNAVMLFLSIKKMNDFKIEPATFFFLIKVIFSAFAMGIILYFINPDFQYWVSISFLYRMILLLALVALGALIFVSLLFIQGVKLNKLSKDNV